LIIKKKDNNSILATIIKIIKNIFELVNKFEKSISAFPYRSEFTVLVSVRIESVKDDLKSIVSKIKNPDNKNRLAKKQVIWMGYCNTSGLSNMDYIIVDPNLVLKNEKKYYAEKVLYLPDIWNCHSGFPFKREEPDLPFEKNKFITFGSFNNFLKIFCFLNRFLKRIEVNNN